jgi:inosose dehydratase
VKRRQFLSTVGAATAASLTPLHALIQSKGSSAIQFGYHAITWGGKDLQAIEEIAAGGFKGIQLRANLIPEYGDKPNALKDILAKHKLTFVAMSSGNVLIDPAREQETIDLHTKHATFVKNAGGLFLQVTDERPKGRDVTPDDFKRMGKLLNEIGKRCTDLGIKLGYHNHMGNLGEKPEEVDGVLAATDPKLVTLELDIAHYTQGGGDPVAAAKKYANRLGFLHFKDVVATPTDKRPYKFVELGQGRVNIAGVADALKSVGFRGWTIVELDGVPDPAKTPSQCLQISKTYIENTLKLKV